MELFNLKDSSDKVDFCQAVKRGLGKQRGLYFPSKIEPMGNISELLDLPLAERSIKILQHLIGEDFEPKTLARIVSDAFTFSAPLVEVTENIHILELFHGPTLAFKDFGARFMAQCLAELNKDSDDPITILTATSGDTGAAVAHAFYGIENINVVILFPKGKISPLQEKLFTTLGGNIHTVAVEGDFDACQHLVKAAFDDPEVREGLHLNSANSINISRLLAQVCYYFEAVAQIPKEQRDEVVFSVPSGNFGNLTAGMIAKTLGLPIKRFIASTNSNDTVPRYWRSGDWSPNATVATLSNAMDVSQPNNWPRIEALFEHGYLDKDILSAEAVDEEYTQMAMRQLQTEGYISEPHAAIAFKTLVKQIKSNEVGVFLGTAHPAKFRETVETVLGQPISLPEPLAECAGKESLAIEKSADYQDLKQHLFAVLRDH